MAAVSPAGPEPTMTTCRASGTSAPFGAAGPALGPREPPGQDEDGAQEGVRRPHAAPEGVHVEQADEGDGGQDAQHDGHDGDDDPEDDAPGHQGEGPDQ